MNVVLLFPLYRILTTKGIKTDKGMNMGEKKYKNQNKEMMDDWRSW